MQPDEVSSSIAPLRGAGLPKVGRNEPCPCGSGRKFKKCQGGAGAA
ncbi:SEC-C metal-binding domain-containing protein [Dyella marensis]